jgi:hypothetical protein
VALSGNCLASSASTAIAGASASTMPRVLPIQVPSQPSWVARVIVANMVLSPGSVRKKATPTARTAAPALLRA